MKKTIFIAVICIALAICLKQYFDYLHGVKKGGDNMNYTYEVSNDLSLVLGTSKIMNISDSFTDKEMTKILGQLISRFGEPVYTTPNLEDAYCYVIIATDENNKQYIFNIYSGPSGPAIGGSSTAGIEDVAYELKRYINQSETADYEYEGYYLDGPAKIVQRIKNGKVFYQETELSDEEYEKALKICYPDEMESE